MCSPKKNIKYKQSNQITGVTLYIIPDSIIYDPRALLGYLRNNRITRQLFTPSLFEALLELNSKLIKESLHTMR